jgi:hypothetical protein
MTRPNHFMPRIERDLLTPLDAERTLLVGLSAEAEVYRLRYSPSFAPGAEIRIAREGADIFVQVERQHLEHGPHPRQRVSPADWARLLDALAGIKFFSMPKHDKDAPVVFDGETWTIEARRPKRGYRSISRHCPEPGFEKVGLIFFELGGCRPRPDMRSSVCRCPPRETDGGNDASGDGARKRQRRACSMITRPPPRPH